MNNFYYGEGTDNTGVSTKLLTINCTVKMSIQNPATFFGIHVSSTALNIFYSRILIGSGQVSFLPNASFTRIYSYMEVIYIPF
ncbi:hypothetical protein Hanom_Chr03g00182391 [Helianthus anomalus]